MTADFTALLEQYGPLLSRVANSYEANAALQQELLQEIAIAVWQGMQRFEGKSSVKTYLLKIAHNRAVSHVASEVRRPVSAEYVDDEAFAATLHTNPEVQASHSHKVEKLMQAVRALPMPGRQVMTLSLEGLSYQEIAEVCGITVSNVGVLLNRAKMSLTRTLEDE